MSNLQVSIRFFNYLSKFLVKLVITFVKVARKYQVWDVKCVTDGQRTFLKSLDSKGAVIINKEDEGKNMKVTVDSSRVLQVDKLLRERSITYQPGSETTSPIPLRHGPRSPRTSAGRQHTPLNFQKCAINWKDFHTLDKINTFMDELETTYPSICTVSAIGHTVEGRPIKMIKISNSDAENTGVWLDGGTHAREWITMSAVTYIADYLARNYSVLPECFTNKDWYIVPVLNPDGYCYSHTSDRQWRKNRFRFGNTIVGVDLNRNFGYCWGQCPNNTSHEPYHLNYRGPEAFSEPEVNAVKNIILYTGTPFKAFVTFHSFSEVIAFPWCHTADPCPDYINLLEGGTLMAKAIYETSGRMYKVGNFKDIMYIACGTSIDWSYGTANIPFSYLVELGSKKNKFLLPKEDILETCQEALSAVSALAKFVDKKKCLNCNVIPKKLRK